MNSLSDITEREWDYLIVGTGMGGATLGHALAKAGRRVLFLEKGTSPRKGPLTRGKSPEDCFTKPGPLTDEHRDALRRAGRYFQRYADHTRGAGAPFFPFMGSGVGGSSALYGAILERFQPLDFTPREAHPGASESTIPREWPVSYAEMLPYYQQAETVYSVHPSPLSEASRVLQAKLTEQGLHPYPLPTATRFVEGCRNCQGMLCARDCKIDSYKACLAPALEQHGASLFEDCEVLGVSADAHRVQDVRCHVDGRELRISAKTVVLAAGAMETPRLLLNSTTTQWPRGLANGSGVVGRNLMRHLVDLYVLNLNLSPQTWGKELGVSDFYATPTGKFGGIHGMGPMPVASTIAELERNPLMRIAGFVSRPVVRAILKRFSSRFNLASFLEDLPFAENRVNGGAETTFQFRIHPYDEQRLKEFRSRLRRALRPLRAKLLRQAEINERLFHACGTCRFGTEPSTSVLDKNNRAHEVENLYVVDASFFPTSGGTAPSLTIAANALRVADHLLGVKQAV
jgi:choline dehydrogenase-like flavoprotein